jgi:outer membrane protein TolC
MKKHFLFYINILFCISSFAQDSTEVFDIQTFYSFIRKYHPIAKQADLFPEMAIKNMQRAQGAFDPYFYTNSEQKIYKDKNYYSLWETGFKVPTWYGVDFKVEYENNGGLQLNEENYLPTNGLVLAGFSVPLAQGLLIDQRRATIKQAEIFSQAANWERNQMLNEVYYEATKQYWEWVLAHNELKILQNAYNVTKERFKAIRITVELGDKPAIDTLEAFLQLQNREYDLNDAKISYKNTALLLSNYLWKENNTPVEISEEIMPQSLDSPKNPFLMGLDSLEMTIQNLENTHPSLRLYHYKLASMEIDRRLKVEKLKPKVNLNYNLLSQEVGKTPIFYKNPFTDNIKWGLNIAFPILLRTERGDLAMTKIKIKDTEYAYQQKQREIGTKVRTYYNESLNLRQQVALYSQIVENYQRMLSAEEQRFFLGESSLFVVNSRESKLIEAKNKLLELRCKYFKSIAGIYYVAGQLYQE